MTNQLLSHSIDPQDLAVIYKETQEQIKQAGDKPPHSVEDLLAMLDALMEFDFGRYLLQNKGINGPWTHYMLTHPMVGRKTGKNNRGEPLSEMESFMLDRAPSMLATQERFSIFLKENQTAVINGAKLACIPCGMMGELLYLDFSDIETISLTGIDFDESTLVEAEKLAAERQLSSYCDFICRDAWQLNIENEFDLISSNGLNIYEPDDEKVTALYRQFYKALKPGGKLVTSFLTPFPSDDGLCEWDFTKLNQEDMLKQKALFADVLGVKWRCFRSTITTKMQLEAAGFKDITFIYDPAKLFPTVTALK